MTALTHAITILGWYENLPEDEMPPRWMWSIAEELEKHFEWVKEKRKDPNYRRDDDDEPSGLTIQNEHARNRGKHAR